jgi:hypothetical protein
MTTGISRSALVACFCSLGAGAACAADPATQSFTAANGLVVTVKMVAPGNEPSPVQMVCYFKHKPSGDRVIEALADFDHGMGGIVQALRDRGEFAGDERETLLFIPPKDSLKAGSVLLIGLGEEAGLSLAAMGRIGTTALREAVRMKAPAVAFAAAIKDQGVTALDAGEVAGAVIHSVVLAYDTEKRLQKERLAPEFSIKEWVYEAGLAYFKSTVEHVEAAVAAADAEVGRREAAPYSHKR